jgi:hypothetical protein
MQIGYAEVLPQCAVIQKVVAAAESFDIHQQQLHQMQLQIHPSWH